MTASNPTKLHLVVWRWHFYAGLFSLPICIILGVTGGIYLFKPVVEPILYRDLWTIEPQGPRLPVEAQLGLVQQFHPDARVTTVTVGQQAEKATEFSLRTQSGATRLVYLNPYSGQFTGSMIRDQMLMRRVRNLHGELMAGSFGSALVELTACWVLILILTGMYLWWPRGKSTVMGVWLPRLGGGGRMFWRDMHAVTAVYASVLILALVLTGLPWANVWGGALNGIQRAIGQDAPIAASRGRVPLKSHPSSTESQPLSTEQAIEVARTRGIHGPVQVVLPRGREGVYGFLQRTTDLTQQQFLYMDQYTGASISKAQWQDFPTIAKAKALGIRFHQGELGVVNFAAMLFATITIVWLAISGAVMWWHRRPHGGLGAPPLPQSFRIPRWLCMLIATLGVLFPLMGLSLIGTFLADRYVLPRMPGLRNFLANGS